MVGGPAAEVVTNPCASMVVPCGIDAMRVTVSCAFGTCVVGTCIHSPGSK